MELIKKMKFILVLIAASMLALASTNTVANELKTGYANTEYDVCITPHAVIGDLYVLKDLQFLRKSEVTDFSKYELSTYENPNIDNYTENLQKYEYVVLNKDFKLLNKIYNTDSLSNYDMFDTHDRQLKHTDKWQKKKRHLLYQTNR